MQDETLDLETTPAFDPTQFETGGFGEGEMAFGAAEEAEMVPAAIGPGQPNLDVIMNIPVTMQVVLGSTVMPVANLMKLGRGAVVKLDTNISDPVDLMVNGRIVARGEVVVLDNEDSRFGITLTEIVTPATAAQRVPKSGAARAAILLLTMGGEGAAKLLKHFSPEELRELRQGAAGGNPVSNAELEEIVSEFQDAFRSGPGLSGLDGELTKLLRSSLSSDELALVFQGEDTGIDSGLPVWYELEQLGPETIGTLLTREHPQVAAYALQRIKAEVAAAIVATMEPARRNDVVRRMLAAKPPTEAMGRLIEQRFRESFVQGSNGAERRARHATLAEIVNRMEKTQTEDLLQAIEAAEPEEAVALRKLLFAFEDVLALPRKSRLLLFDAIPTETVTQSLAGAEPDLREAVLSSLGARARRMVEAELSRGEAPNADAVQAARRTIAASALRLSAEGRIDLTEKAEG